MIRRLILRLEPDTIDLGRLTRYAALARALNVELLAQIEEDEHLALLAGLPFVKEVCRGSASCRQLSDTRLQREREQLLQHLRTMLQSIAEHQQVRWRLDRVNANTPLQPEQDAAVLRSAPSRRYLSTRSATVSQDHVTVLHNGDAASDRALELARQVSQTLQLPLLLLALPDSPWHQLEQPPPQVTALSSIASVDPALLARLLRAWHSDLLIGPASLLHPLMEREPLPDVQLLLTA